MSKRISETEFDAIVAVIRSNGGGVGAEGIQAGLTVQLPPRTLQRRLKELEDQGRISSRGAKRGKRYFYRDDETGAVRENPTAYRSPDVAEEEISLSAAALEIRCLIRVPRVDRKPVGYNSAFLESYIPNETAYLPAAMRVELARIGQVGLSDLPAGTYLRKVLDRLLIDLSWNSSRLEGNTYSRLETERLLAVGESAEGRGTRETQMILNHKGAIEMLAEQAGEIGFNRYTICNLHALLSDNLLSDSAACGRLRDRAVGISGTVYHPLEVPQQVELYFQMILDKAEAIRDPYEQAFFAMVHLPYLQPFEDVNKRVSRLAANIPLVKFNLCPLSFVDVPKDDYINALIGIYELNRVDYLREVFDWACRRSAARYSAVLQSLGDPDPFRLRYRDQVAAFVRSVVAAGWDKSTASRWIAREAGEKVPEHVRARFVEVVELELSSLHEGNIARYRLRPGEFRLWLKGWK